MNLDGIAEKVHLPTGGALVGLGVAAVAVAGLAIYQRSKSGGAAAVSTDPAQAAPVDQSGGSAGGGYYSAAAPADPVAEAQATAQAEVTKQAALYGLSKQAAADAESLRESESIFDLGQYKDKGHFDFNLNDAGARRDNQFLQDNARLDSQLSDTADRREYAQAEGTATRIFGQNEADATLQNGFAAAQDFRTFSLGQKTAEGDFQRSEQGKNNDLKRTAQSSVLGMLSTEQATLAADEKRAQELRGAIPGYSSKKGGFLGTKTSNNKSEIDRARAAADAADKEAAAQRLRVQNAAKILSGQHSGLTSTVNGRSPALTLR